MKKTLRLRSHTIRFRTAVSTTANKYKNAKWHLHSPAKRFRALQFAMHRDGGLIGLLCEVISKKLNSRQICWGDAKHYDYIMARLICIETWTHNHLRWISHYVQPTKIVGLGYLQKKGSNCCKISALEGVFYLHGVVGVPCQIATEIGTGYLFKYNGQWTKQLTGFQWTSLIAVDCLAICGSHDGGSWPATKTWK